MIRSFPFDAVLDSSGVPDRAYLSIDFARYFAKFISNGVFPNPSTGLQVIAVDNNMQIRIKKGDGYIEGRVFENTDDYIFKLEPADGVLNRIDRVVLRLDYLKRDIIPVLKKGDYASNAVAKSLQRDADAYEIALADIYVRAGVIAIIQSNITDLRLNTELCGIVHGTVDQVDTTAIFNQYMDWFQKTKGQAIADITTVKTQFENAFNTWFNSIKNILDGDTAGNLLNLINQNTAQIKEISINTEKQIQNVNNNVGDKAQLPTKDKSNLVNAIKEVFQSANNSLQQVNKGKEQIKNAVVGKDSSISLTQNPTFEDLSSAISKISTKKLNIDLLNSIKANARNVKDGSEGINYVFQNGDVIISSSHSSSLRLHDKLGNLLHEIKVENKTNYPIRLMATDEKNLIIRSGYSNDNRMFLTDINGNLIKTLNFPEYDKIRMIVFTKSFIFVAYGAIMSYGSRSPGKIDVYDRNMNLIKTISGIVEAYYNTDYFNMVGDLSSENVILNDMWNSKIIDSTGNCINLFSSDFLNSFI